MAYARAHKEALNGLVLRGIYTGTKEEHDHVYRGDTAARFPEAWNILAEKAGPVGQADILSRYRDLIMSGDAAAMAIWSLYETYVTSPTERAWTLAAMRAVLANPEDAAKLLSPEEPGRRSKHRSRSQRATAIMQVLLFPDLERHHQLADRAGLGGIGCKVFIVQGREDDICPRKYAESLAAAMRAAGVDADLKVVPGASHSPRHPEMTHWLITATDALRPAAPASRT